MRSSIRALLDKWQVFPNLVEPIRCHHQVNPDSKPGSVLLALANCLVKGLYPFPDKINIPEEFREAHFPGGNGKVTSNPLPEAFDQLVKLFEEEKTKLSLSAGELETGQYKEENIEGVIGAAKEAAFNGCASYMGVLSDQNPEFADVVEWSKQSPEDLLALTLLLKDYLTEMMVGLVKSTGTTK